MQFPERLEAYALMALMHGKVSSSPRNGFFAPAGDIFIVEESPVSVRDRQSFPRLCWHCFEGHRLYIPSHSLRNSHTQRSHDSPSTHRVTGTWAIESPSICPFPIQKPAYLQVLRCAAVLIGDCTLDFRYKLRFSEAAFVAFGGVPVGYDTGTIGGSLAMKYWREQLLNME